MRHAISPNVPARNCRALSLNLQRTTLSTCTCRCAQALRTEPTLISRRFCNDTVAENGDNRRAKAVVNNGNMKQMIATLSKTESRAIQAAPARREARQRGSTSAWGRDRRCQFTEHSSR
jgi:hypothetical protein